MIMIANLKYFYADTSRMNYTTHILAKVLNFDKCIIQIVDC